MSALIAATAFAGTVAAGQDLRKARVAEWKPIVAKFQKPSALRAAWQLTNSVALYVLLWFLMYWSLKISHLLTLSLTILSGANTDGERAEGPCVSLSSRKTIVALSSHQGDKYATPDSTRGRVDDGPLRA